MSNPLSTVAGATALGIGTVIGLEELAKYFPQLQELLNDALDPSFKQLMHVERALIAIKELLDEGTDTTQLVVLSKFTAGPETRIFDYKKRHFLMFLPAVLTVTFNVAGLPGYNVSLPAGWNLIDLPTATTIVIQPSDPNNQMAVMFRESNSSWGNPI